MDIKQALVEDAEEIITLQKLAYQSEAEIYNNFTIPPLTQTLEEIKKDFLYQIFLKALINAKIIGSVRAYQKEETCYISRLIVNPDFQNKGIGTKMMNEIESIFQAAKRFELFTGYKSERNLCLYQKLGYKEFKREDLSDNMKIVYLEKRNGGINKNGIDTGNSG